MKNYLRTLDAKTLRLIKAVQREADRHDIGAYVVGGVVRDIMLRRPVGDLDITVEGNAVALARKLAKTLKARLTVHRAFKTATLRWPGGMCLDLATARQEAYDYPGALPTVSKGSLSEDLFRRDFTVNAMAVAVNGQARGALTDEYGGARDLKRKKIRVLHAKSFIDDPTRILRAVRFEQRFGFTIEPATLKLLKAALNKHDERTVKPPRYFAEFKKILGEEDPVKPLERLRRLGGLRFLGRGGPASPTALKRLHRAVRSMKRSTAFRDYGRWWLIYLCGLIGHRRAAGDLAARFQMGRSAQTAVRECRRAETLLRQLTDKDARASDVYAFLKPLTEDTVVYLYAAAARTAAKRRIARYLTHDRHVRLKVSGHDLSRLSVTSGEKIGLLLKELLLMKIDRKIRNAREERKAARTYARKRCKN